MENSKLPSGIRQVSSGKFQIRYTGPDGKRYSGGTYRTKTDARNALAIIQASISDRSWRQKKAQIDDGQLSGKSTLAEWAEEDTEYAVRQHALSEAKSRDAEALRAAAIAGEKDPGTKATDEAARALLYQEERVRAAARTVSKESQALSSLFREHRFELMEEACVTAERTVETFQEEIAEVRKLVRESEVRRHEGLAPLRWVASLTDSSLSYDPSFPIEGSFQLPRTSEQKVLGIAALLRKFFLDKPGEAA